MRCCCIGLEITTCVVTSFLKVETVHPVPMYDCLRDESRGQAYSSIHDPVLPSALRFTYVLGLSIHPSIHPSTCPAVWLSTNSSIELCNLFYLFSDANDTAYGI
ncbi:hypothetical protein PoB_003359900 [Plakobranchus ocellatus]|uniref:Uncharacterized protein n=1 Tax=Plakobranchus ocellatus TaxID=259542 RepID=A0AAV4ALI1_9GAST|nr:hypothetical protein PoB_003359900 [Plakobranchus ocellatus]